MGNYNDPKQQRDKQQQYEKKPGQPGQPETGQSQRQKPGNPYQQPRRDEKEKFK